MTTTRADHHALTDVQRARGVRRVLLVTLVLNLCVAAAKVAYGSFVGSLSIRADGFHSTTDGLNNVVLLLGSWLAAAPPDREHPYGHRKIEVFAAGAIGLSLLVVAADVVSDVVTRLRGLQEPPRIDANAFVVLGVTLAVNVGVAVWEAREGKRLQSPALVFDALHTRSDVVVTLGVALAAGLTWWGVGLADVVTGALVAAFVATTGVRILKENASYLMDTSLVEADVVEEIACAHAEVSRAFDIRSRGTPGNVWIELAIAVDGDLSVRIAHAIAHDVEAAIRTRVEGVAGVQVHVEPS